MHKAFSKHYQKISIWLSILLHVLFFFSISMAWMFPNKFIDKPDLNIPAYLYQGAIRSETFSEEKNQRSAPNSKNGIEKPAKTRTLNARENRLPNPLQMTTISTPTTYSEPVHLIGDKKIRKPLLELIGKALTAHLIYPRIAIDFNIKGVTLVGFNLQPNGDITGVQIVKTSGASVLDKAVLLAMKEMSPVLHVDQFLKQSEYMVIGIIFQ